MELLSDRAPNEAYLPAKPGACYALYFTNGGSVSLDLTEAPGTFGITWISVAMGVVVTNSQAATYDTRPKVVEGGRVVTIFGAIQQGRLGRRTRQKVIQTTADGGLRRGRGTIP